jgi:hypothetical protein
VRVGVPSEAEAIADDRPFIAQLIMQLEQFFFLLELPILAIETGIEVVVVADSMKCLPLATLLPRPT